MAPVFLPLRRVPDRRGVGAFLAEHGHRLGPEIRPFEEEVIKKSIEYGVQPRIEIGSVDQADRYVQLGVRHFCIGWDRFIYKAGLIEIGEGMRKLVETI